MLICYRCFRNGPDICHALDLTTCTSLKTLKFIFSADSEEVSSFRDMEHLWLESCISASTYLLVTHRHTLRALRVVRFVMDVDGAGSLVLNTLLHATQEGRAMWRSLEAALMDIRTLTRVEVVVRDYCGRLNEERRNLLRVLVEVGLAALIESHGATRDEFFHFSCSTKRPM